MEHDIVNHPSHYCQDDSIECIDEMLIVFGKEAVMHFCLCNVWKYRKRALFKNGKEDLKKSDWYMKKYKELKEEKTAPTVTVTSIPSSPITVPIKEIGDTCPETWIIGDKPYTPSVTSAPWNYDTITAVKNN